VKAGSKAEVWAAHWEGVKAGVKAALREAPREVSSAESMGAEKAAARVEVSAASKEGCSGARSVAYLAEHQEATAGSDLMAATEERTC
jgi:hypothetical protein